MESEFANLNWTAVLAGTIAAYALGMIWFSPLLFGKGWSKGSHNLQPPEQAPVGAMVIMFAATLLLALLIGMTETRDMLLTAIVGILACALTVAGMAMFSQKTTYATVVDAGYVVAMGVIMILAQAIF